jgi:hypothetical protein
VNECERNQNRFYNFMLDDVLAGDLQELDTFFQTIVSGTMGVDPTSLIGTGGGDALYKAIDTLYRDMRRPWTDVSPAEIKTVMATGSKPGDRMRIIQNAVTKWILQGMLLTITTSGALAYWLTDMRYILPHEPCSIAGRASLLAGSRLCGELGSEGTRLWSEEQLRDTGFLAGRRLRLGWWDEDGRPIDDPDRPSKEKGQVKNDAKGGTLVTVTEAAGQDERSRLRRRSRFGIDVLSDDRYDVTA